MNIGVVVFPAAIVITIARTSLKMFWASLWRWSGTRKRCCQGLMRSCLPGGFSYGDYLRTGAIARFSPVMRAVKAFANKGGLVIGICNGFQILLEAGLLPV